MVKCEMYLIFFTKEGLLMISEIETTTDPVLSREDAIAILNTPDEELDQLIAQAEKLRRKYKGNHVSIHILTNARSGNCSQDCAYCAQSCRSKADIDKYKWVADEKLYKDNDFVNEHHLSRHCIGLSGMKFTDEEIEEEYRKIASGYTVDIEKVKASIPVESLSEDIVLRKAVDLVKENAKITVAVPEEAPKAAKKTRAKKAETADGEEKTEAKPKRTKKAAEPKAEDKAE